MLAADPNPSRTLLYAFGTLPSRPVAAPTTVPTTAPPTNPRNPDGVMEAAALAPIPTPDATTELAVETTAEPMPPATDAAACARVLALANTPTWMQQWGHATHAARTPHRLAGAERSSVHTQEAHGCAGGGCNQSVKCRTEQRQRHRGSVVGAGTCRVPRVRPVPDQMLQKYTKGRVLSRTH